MVRYCLAIPWFILTVGGLSDVMAASSAEPVHLRCDEFERSSDGGWKPRRAMITVVLGPEQKSRDVYFLDKSHPQSFSDGNLFAGVNIAAVLNEQCQ